MEQEVGLTRWFNAVIDPRDVAHLNSGSFPFGSMESYDYECHELDPYCGTEIPSKKNKKLPKKYLLFPDVSAAGDQPSDGGRLEASRRTPNSFSKSPFVSKFLIVCTAGRYLDPSSA